MHHDIFDVTAQDFQSIVAQGSITKPVLVVFWSSQCTICPTLLMNIEQLQGQHNNAFAIAKVNCDTEQPLVQHFSIKSVPTAYLFVNGQAADGFAGEQSMGTLEAFIQKHLPDPALALLADTQTLFAQGQLDEAKATILQAQKLSPEDNQIKLTLAQIYLALGEFESAKPILNAIPMADQNMIYHSLVSELELAEQSAQTPEIKALEAALETAEDKQAIQYQLAVQYHQAKRYQEALHLLYEVLSHTLDYEQGNAKKTMLDLLATIDDAALVSQYRRKLYSLLY